MFVCACLYFRSRSEKLKVMEAVLDNMPPLVPSSVATSAVTTRTNTPASLAPTPSDFLPIEALSSTLQSRYDKQQQLPPRVVQLRSGPLDLERGTAKTGSRSQSEDRTSQRSEHGQRSRSYDRVAGGDDGGSIIHHAKATATGTSATCGCSVLV